MEQNTFGVAPRSFMERLFPARHLEPLPHDRPPEPGFAPGEMITVIRVEVSLLDRLRVLVSGSIHVEVRTATDVEVQRAKSRSAMYVLAP